MSHVTWRIQANLLRISIGLSCFLCLLLAGVLFINPLIKNRQMIDLSHQTMILVSAMTDIETNSLPRSEVIAAQFAGEMWDSAFCSLMVAEILSSIQWHQGEIEDHFRWNRLNSHREKSCVTERLMAWISWLHQNSPAIQAQDLYYTQLIAQRVAEIDTSNADAIYFQGLVLQKMGRNDEAIAYYQQAINMVDTMAKFTLSGVSDAYYGYAILVARQADPPDWNIVGHELYQAIQFNDFRFDNGGPNLYRSYYLYGTVLLHENQSNKALHKFQKSLSVFPTHYGANLYVGRLTWEIHQNFEAAEKFLLKAQQINPKRPDASISLGDIHVETGQWEQAMTYYQASLTLIPENQPLYDAVLQKMQKIEQGSRLD
ncbi:MAG: tetratricopeptide repeat protein [Chloroflexota bacterium]